MNLWVAVHENFGYIGSKSGHRTIRTRAYLVPHSYRFTRYGWLLANHCAYQILQKYSFKEYIIYTRYSILSITYYNPVSDVKCLSRGWNCVCPVRSIYQIISNKRNTSLFRIIDVQSR